MLVSYTPSILPSNKDRETEREGERDMEAWSGVRKGERNEK